MAIPSWGYGFTKIGIWQYQVEVWQHQVQAMAIPSSSCLFTNLRLWQYQVETMALPSLGLWPYQVLGYGYTKSWAMAIASLELFLYQVLGKSYTKFGAMAIPSLGIWLYQVLGYGYAKSGAMAISSWGYGYTKSWAMHGYTKLRLWLYQVEAMALPSWGNGFTKLWLEAIWNEAKRGCREKSCPLSARTNFLNDFSAILYFLARNRTGWGSVPHKLWKYKRCSHIRSIFFVTMIFKASSYKTSTLKTAFINWFLKIICRTEHL